MSLFSFLSGREVYSDITKDLTINPVSQDIAKKTNEEAVKESLKNLILTSRGERLFHPEIGCGIREMLFDTLTPDRIIVMREMIKETITNHEPRVNLIDVDVLAGLDEGTVSITIIFNVINIETPVTYTITLNRVR